MTKADKQQLLTYLSRTTQLLSESIAGLPQWTLVIRPSPDEFSVVENICHLRDIEVEGYTVRIRRLLREDNPKLADIDGAKLAAERDYNQQDLHDALADFTRARNENLNTLRNASEDEFDREGELEGVGRMNLGQLMQMMWEHDEGHLDELKTTRTRLLKANHA